MPNKMAAAFAVALAMAPQVALASHVKIWLKAFIPSSGLDIVRAVPGTPGHTMIPGPRLMGIPVDTACYNTNDRGFSKSPGVDAKITIVTEFDVVTPGIANVVETAPKIGETIRYDCDSGKVLGRKSASSQDVKLGRSSFNAGTVTIPVDAEASNPFVPLPPSVSPSIKVHGALTIDTVARKAKFVGTVAAFPSYEAYIAVDGATPVAIFQVSPGRDASAWSLLLKTPVNASTTY